MYPNYRDHDDIEILWKLARDKRIKSRVAAVRSPEATREIMEFLVADESPAVRRVIAKREGPDSADLLRTLCRDPDLKVRQSVVENSNCPADVLRELVNDSHKSVRWSVPDHPNSDINVKREITAPPDGVLRRIMAEYDTLEPEIVHLLMEDQSSEVKEGLAAHTALPDVLAALVDPKIRAGAAQNPRTTPEQRHTLARDPSALVRANLLKFVELPEEDLRLLAHDRSINVRWWLAVWPDTPNSILETLEQDPNDEVSEAAKSTLKKRK
ncbi:HEAT repeat domain-containing protein [Streptosporangium sp. NPDC006930]|uniref:HEAT repeat domain-containing protein n=1 Tax=Streptosporangium sp. NPDC006930 TaxID=3154783 RepID=UPI003447A1F8